MGKRYRRKEKTENVFSDEFFTDHDALPCMQNSFRQKKSINLLMG